MEYCHTFVNTLVALSSTTAFLIALSLIGLLAKWFLGDKVEIEINVQSVKITANRKLRDSARVAYVELTSRKIALAFDEENDAISEIYNSFYESFRILRELKKGLSKNGGEGKLYAYVDDFLECQMRPHLTKYQSRYRTWLNKRCGEKDYIDENSAQKKYSKYPEIIKEIKVINKSAMSLALALEKIAYKKENKND